MKDKIYVLGHKNPDTDSICAAIGYCCFKKTTGVENIYPGRLGRINKETEFVLDYFGVETPELIKNVKMQVMDMNIDRVVSISSQISAREAWNVMREQHVKTLPVVNGSGQLIGICTISDLTRWMMDVLDNNLFAQSRTSFQNVLKTISGHIIGGNTFDFANAGRVIVAAMDTDEIGRIVGEDDVVIVGNRKDAQRKAISCGASCIIITDGLMPDGDVIDLADQCGCMIVSVPYDAYTTSRLINMSIPVSFVMTTDDIISFDIEDYIDDIKDIMLDTRYRSYPVISGGKVVGTISRYHLIKSGRKKVILVDHNERSQAVDGLDEAEILEIIDHHRVGDIQTSYPVNFVNRPIGSTSTIIANLFFNSGLPIPSKVAGVLCAAIISDTLLFKSPTSTKVDEEAVKRLSKIAGIDIYDFGNKMFRAGTSLAGKSAKDIFYQDFKEFYLKNKKIGIGQVYTMDIDGIAPIKSGLLEFMEDARTSKEYDLLILMLTDIIHEGSELLFTSGGREVISRAFEVHPDRNGIYIPGVVSRKKQVVPPIASILDS